MPKPISRKELIRRLRLLGFDGPYAGGKHSGMRKGPLTVPIPNAHVGDIDWSLTKRLLRRAGINPEEWDKLGQ